MAKILDGKKVAENLKFDLFQKFQNEEQLKFIIVHHNDEASSSYLKGRKKISEFLNVNLIEFVIDQNLSQQELIQHIQQWNQDSTIHGIMVDRPLPSRFDENIILSQINPNKDIDGYTFTNLGKLISNEKSFLSCTPAAAIQILDFYNISLEGKNVVVIGRSINVGKPLAMMLLNKNATVTIAHSKTKNLEKICKRADIIFTCVGKANFLTKNFVSKKTIIVDIGINFDEHGKLCGDVAKECYEYVTAYTPVPGGVGVITNLMLMSNLYLAYKKGL